MRRWLALVLAVGTVACGGGGDDDGPEQTPTDTPTQQVAGVRDEPTQAPSPTREARPSKYTVVEGDTLSAIAERFGTSVAALMTANNLADADVLAIGQELNIPAAGAATATTSPTATQ